MHQHRRWVALYLALLIALFVAIPAQAVSPSDYKSSTPQILEAGHLYAEAAVLMDGETGEMLLQKNARERMYPASTTKIMTLLLALESGIPMDTMIVIPQQAKDITSDSTLVPVFPGDMMTFEDLLYGFMLRSGNDGANAVAALVSGSLEAFVERMNTRAQEIGCTGTHFMNAHGLPDDNHYTTAYDLALITRYGMQLESFRQIVSTWSHTMSITRGGQTIQLRVTNTDLMLNPNSVYYYKDNVGVKTGTTTKAGNCFVGCAERDGVQLITVALKCSESSLKWRDTQRMYDYGFTRYTAYTLDQMFSRASERITTVRISNAAADDPYSGMLEMKIAHISDSDYKRMVQTGNDEAMEMAVQDFASRLEINLQHSLTAPVSEGEIMGNLVYHDQSGKRITAMLVAARAVDEQLYRPTLVDFIPALKKLDDPLVKALLIVLLILLIFLIFYGIARRNRKDRRRKQIYEARRQQYLRQMHSELHRSQKARRRHGTRIRRAKGRRAGDDSYDRYDDDLFGNY